MVDSRINEPLSEASTPVNLENVDVARESFRQYRKTIKEVEVEVHSVENQTISYNNLSIPIRIYTPEGKGPFPMLIYFHGGGFVLGDLDIVDNLCRYLCKHGEQIVISIDYRLAPEHPYPAAIEDALASIRWSFKHANYLNGINRNISVAGDSAGGNLATQAAILLRNFEEITINSQWLFYPWLDFRLESESHKLYGKGYNLTTEELKWYRSHYLQDTTMIDLPNVSPLQHEDLSGLPDTVIVTAEHDPLQNDGLEYAKELMKAGNSVDYMYCKNVTHSFLNMTGELSEARKILDLIVNKMKARNKVICDIR